MGGRSEGKQEGGCVTDRTRDETPARVGRAPNPAGMLWVPMGLGRTLGLDGAHAAGPGDRGPRRDVVQP